MYYYTGKKAIYNSDICTVITTLLSTPKKNPEIEMYPSKVIKDGLSWTIENRTRKAWWGLKTIKIGSALSELI
jgi:hypothetical protein